MGGTIPLHAMEVQVSPSMEGFKFAVQFGNGPVYVSPAVWDLMTNSTPAELETLLKNLPLKRFPALPDFRNLSIPMTTPPPNPDDFEREMRRRIFLR